MRYKRFKSRYHTEVIKRKFQSFFDISTDEDMQIISVNAGGNDVLKRCPTGFAGYKYFKLGGVSIKLIPASTLPVDPTGLSYEAGESTVDPRDQLTPGMCRITNGEDILEDISNMTKENQIKLYNNMLLDPRWYKWMLQSGVKRYATPRFWQIGQLHQDKWPGAIMNYPALITEPATGQAIGKATNMQSTIIDDAEGHTVYQFEASGSSKYGIFQTGHKGKLGWMPTDAYQGIMSADDGEYSHRPLIANIPEIELFKILMPPARKTKYYYRAFVTETVYFKDPIVLNINDYRPIDVFHTVGLPIPADPTAQFGLNDSYIDQLSGGNDGRS